jgi:magnesium chelatase subunit I
VNQRSGVSVRLSIANHEALVANAARRALRLGETTVVPRVSDLEAIAASTAGKIELDTIDDRDIGDVVETLVHAAVLTVFRDRFEAGELREVLTGFEDGSVAHAGDDLPSADYVELWNRIGALHAPVEQLLDGTPGSGDGGPDPALVASAVEFVLEGLHLSKRLNKDAMGARATYRSRR